MRILQTICKILKNVQEFVINKTVKFRIDSEYCYNEIVIKILRNRHVANVRLHDVFSDNMDSSSISEVYENIQKTDFKYFNIVSYERYGIYVYLSNSITSITYNNERRGIQRVTLPVKSNRNRIKRVLHDILLARENYKSHKMIDFEADLSEDSLIISSRSNSIKMKLFKLSKSLPDEKNEDMYILKRFEDFDNWYIMSPLSRYGVNRTIKEGIIISNEQLKENVIPPTELFTPVLMVS